MNNTLYIIVLLNILLIFFLHDTRFLKLLNHMHNLNTNIYINAAVIITLVSLAGTPPLLGFFGKYLFSIILFNKKFFVLIFLFVFLNVFLIYFYILNVRFAIADDQKCYFYIKKNCVYYNTYVSALFLFFFFLNLFSLFFFFDFIVFFKYACSFNI